MTYRRSYLVVGICIFVAGLPASASEPAAPAVSSRTIAEIDELFADAIAKRAMPGASVTVAWDDGRAFTRSYGIATDTPTQPVTAGTLFRFGSISKLFTSLAILKLVEEDRIKLDTPVAAIFPNQEPFSRYPSSVTVRRLLNHTSGLADFRHDEILAKVDRGYVVEQDNLSVLARPLSYEPGTEWVYADAPFRLLSMIVEKVSGLSYGEFITQRLAPSLTLPSVRLCEPGAPNHAAGFVSRDAKLLAESAYSIRGLLGEGGLCGSTADLARLPGQLAKGNWLSTSALSQMLEVTRLLDGVEVDYGLGVRGGWLGPARAWGHTGGGPDGSWAAFAHYPERNVSIAVTANGTGSEIDAATLQAGVASIILDLPKPLEKPLEATGIRQLKGAYTRRGRITCMDFQRGRLHRTRLGNAEPSTPLLYQGDLTFARDDFPLDRIIFQAQDQRVPAYRVYYDGFFSEYWRRSPKGCG